MYSNLFILSIVKNHNNLMEEQKSKICCLQSDNSLPDTIPSFLLKTYQILENDKYNDIICWTKTGEGFIVKKVKQFSENILPIYFRHSNYTSFVRQLNMYDFHKTRQQNHQNAFKNLMFKKGLKNLLKDIQRKDYKKNKDNGKQGNSMDKSNEKFRQFSKNEKQYDLSHDLGRQNIKKLSELNRALQKKTLLLAQTRQLPPTQGEMLKLLDNLFDSKKLYQEMIHKMEQVATFFTDMEKMHTFNPVRLQKTAEKLETNRECPTTDPKETRLELPKEEQNIGTTCTLFSTFNQG